MANSHKRETSTRRRLPIGAATLAVTTAVGLTAAAVAVGVTAAKPAIHPVASAPLVVVTPDLTRSLPVSRSDSRTNQADRADLEDRQLNSRLSGTSAFSPRLAKAAAAHSLVASAHLQRWTTDELNLWDGPGPSATQVGLLSTGTHVLVTGRSRSGRDEVVVKGVARWVTSGYLSDAKPVAAAAGLSHDPCPDSSVEYRLTAAAIYVYRSVCHAFPQITTYGGWAPRGEHADGKAIDIMTTDTELGNAIRAFLIEHAAELDLYDVIWQQHIWTPVRASEGFRLMPDRGSPTANHYDHVHVSVN